MKNWDDMRHVLAVARGNGLSGAARALGVNHSTVSRRIAAFEERLGARLFDRRPDGYLPTEAGAQAVAAAESMERIFTDLETGIAASDLRATGKLVVTAPLMIVMGPFATALADFRERYPEIELRVIATNDLLNLHRREADVAIRATDTPDEGLFGVRLSEQRAAIYAAPSYLRRMRAVLEGPRATAKLDWIGRNEEDSPPADVASLFPSARVTARFDDKLAMMAAAKAGMGLVRLPCFHGDPDPALERVPDTPLSRYPDKWVLTHPALKNTVRVRLFLSMAAEVARRMRPLFMGSGRQ